MPSPDRQPQIDGFGLTFPFPLRVATLLVAGFWGWAINLHLLAKTDIDVPALIRYPSSAAASSSQRSHHASAYRLASILTVPLTLWLVVFWIVTHCQYELVGRYDYIPQSVFTVLLLILIWPFNRASRAGRIRLLWTLKRVAIGGLAEAQDGKFADVLLADALTSYARVLADLYISFCMFFSDFLFATSKPDRGCGKDFITPLIIAIPSVIRLRQCLTEYFRARRATSRREQSKASQHLANALKYSTAFPVIYLNAKLRNYNPFYFHGFSEVTIIRLLFIFSCINSGYSFWWDVVKDWDFTLFSSKRLDREHPYGLRRHRVFSSDRLYHGVIVADLLLRFSWLWRVLPGLAWLSETESGLFLLMFLEVARRWMWVFFRVEAEWLRNTQGPALDDVLLGDLSYKLDAD